MLAWIKTHKLLLFIITLLILAAWYFFGRGSKDTYEEAVVSRNNIRETLELSGEIKAGQSATLRFGAGGLVTYLGAKEGDVIKKWQTLASVDTRQLQKTLEQKLNLYAIQRGTFDQTIDDNDNSVPGGDLGRTLERLLAKNQYQLDNTVKDVEYQDLTIKLSRLSSPITGVLIQSPLSTANVQVLPSDIWIVVDPTSLYFSADLDETDLKRVNVGQKAIITLDAYTDKEIKATISKIAYTPTETSTGTTYEVTIALTPDDAKDLRLGLNGTAAIVLSEKEGVLTLPASAITSKNGDSLVLIKSANKYTEHKIETGIENEGMVEILNGLGEEDHVYTKK